MTHRPVRSISLTIDGVDYIAIQPCDLNEAIIDWLMSVEDREIMSDEVNGSAQALVDSVFLSSRCA